MSNDNAAENANEKTTKDADQAIQINDNTIADPNPPEAVPGDDHLHSRKDVDNQDQAMQINDNTIADEK